MSLVEEVRAYLKRSGHPPSVLSIEQCDVLIGILKGDGDHTVKVAESGIPAIDPCALNGVLKIVNGAKPDTIKRLTKKKRKAGVKRK